MKLSKRDIKIMIEQSKEMIKNCDVTLRISKEAQRKAMMDKAAAKGIIKFLGGK